LAIKQLMIKFKNFFKKLSAILVILLIVFSPYFLIIDFRRYAPVVLIVWVLSIVYYIFVKKK